MLSTLSILDKRQPLTFAKAIDHAIGRAHRHTTNSLLISIQCLYIVLAPRPPDTYIHLKVCYHSLFLLSWALSMLLTLNIRFIYDISLTSISLSLSTYLADTTLLVAVPSCNVYHITCRHPTDSIRSILPSNLPPIYIPYKSPTEAQITLYIIIPLTRTYHYYTITTLLCLSIYIYVAQNLSSSLAPYIHISSLIHVYGTTRLYLPLS